ncbi:MAG: HAMP domain-containing histidine kinase [Spirulina sp. SIO3F2]|nr:HAMP domain-containing histidine kinase [Spirulina sp. SIO3F2]
MKLLHHPYWLMLGVITVLILVLANMLFLAPTVNQLEIKGVVYAIAGISVVLLMILAIGLRRLLEEFAQFQSQNQPQEIAHQPQSEIASEPPQPSPTLSELKLQFVARVSHEFRTPLSAILISAQLLDSPKAQHSEQKRQRNLKRIQSSVKSLNQLLADLLLLTHAEAGQLELNPQTIDLSYFCQELLEDIKKNISEPHELVLNITGDCPDAHLDEQIVRSMLMSLLRNAIQYSLPESLVTLKVVGNAKHTRFQVCDQGIGIPVAEQAQVFEVFKRGQNVKGIPGSGLGLAVVKTCLELHGGAIAVESQLNCGTTVTVDLPWLLPETMQA